MKKLITIMLVISMLTLAGCGKKEETVSDFNPDGGSSTSEVSIPDIEESSEEPEVEEESPVDFDFMNGEEVNAEAIVAHTHELGVLENTWNNATEINPDDIINAYEEKNREKYESFAQDGQEYIVQIPEEDMDNVPKYLSFVKLEETVADTTTTGGTTSGSGTGGTTSGGTTSGGTGGTTSGGTTTGGGSGSMWDGIDLPGDPNVEDEIVTHHSNAGWK